LTTPKLLLPELVVGQAGKELTHNQALAILDQLTQPIVVDKDLAAPPGSPANGSMYIVAAAATGLWVGQSGKLAVWLTTVAAWTFITPANGWSVWVNDESERYERVSGSWVVASAGANSAALDGLTGAADRKPYFTGLGTMALAVYTAAARTLDAAIDAAAQRTVLGLGTAAVATAQTSTTDATAGRLLAVGAFGYGATIAPAVSAISTDLNLVLTSGIYRIVGAETNAPMTPVAGHILEVLAWNGGTVYQNYYGLNGQRRFTRTVGQAWVELFTSVGVNTVNVDTGSTGYGTGAGGTVTQATSKSTAVTLNKPSGRITLNAASLAANTAVSFTLTNSRIGATDTLPVSINGGATAGAYVVQVDAVAAGSCTVSIRNMTAGALAEAIVIQFNLIKGAIA
jgi:hypothetical protein